MSDEALLELAASGDEEAWTGIYRRRRSSIYRFAVHMTGSPALAEDITQETFLALIHHCGQFDSRRGSLAAYLIGIARKQLLRHFERSAVLAAISGDFREGAALTPEALIDRRDPQSDFSKAERIEALRRSVLALPERYRTAVVLCDLQEMTYEEAALAAECSVGTIRSRLHRARTLLAKKLHAPESSGESSPELKTKRCLV